MLKLTTEKALLAKEEIIKLGNNIVETYLPSVLEPSSTLIAQYVKVDMELSEENVIEDIELIVDVRKIINRLDAGLILPVLTIGTLSKARVNKAQTITDAVFYLLRFGKRSLNCKGLVVSSTSL